MNLAIFFSIPGGLQPCDDVHDAPRCDQGEGRQVQEDQQGQIEVPGGIEGEAQGGGGGGGDEGQVKLI